MSKAILGVGILQALATIPWDEVVDMVEAAQEGGLDEDEAIQATVELLDVLVDLSILGTPGEVLELVDAAVLGAIIRLVWATQSPEKVAARQARRGARRARRQERRAARRANRGGDSG